MKIEKEKIEIVKKDIVNILSKNDELSLEELRDYCNYTKIEIMIALKLLVADGIVKELYNKN